MIQVRCLYHRVMTKTISALLFVLALGCGGKARSTPVTENDGEDGSAIEDESDAADDAPGGGEVDCMEDPLNNDCGEKTAEDPDQGGE